MIGDWVFCEEGTVSSLHTVLRKFKRTAAAETSQVVSALPGGTSRVRLQTSASRRHYLPGAQRDRSRSSRTLPWKAKSINWS